MKKLLTIMTFAALALPTGSFAADKKKEAAAPAAETKPAAAAAPAAKEEKKAGGAIPMHTRADMIDVAGKSFTTKRKDGVEVKHMLTATTDIKNGAAAAKLEDIKAGDYVNGLRMKKSDTEYEVVKITKFGPAAPKEEKKAEKAAEKTEKTEAKKQ